MYYSFNGTIVDIDKESIAIEVHDIAYSLLVSRPQEFHLGESTKVFVYEVLGENEHYLVGFLSKLEKRAFESLIQVKGIGPKTALGALKETTPDDLFKAIASNNTAYLKKLPGIGPKAAAQIILDLKGILAETDAKGNPTMYDDVREALKQLGFKVKAIDDVLSKINLPEGDDQAILREALKRLQGGAK